MRRSRFADAVEISDVNAPRASVAEAMSFDISPPGTAQDETLSHQRVSQLHHIPLLLGAMHLLFAIALVGYSLANDNSALITASALPLGSALALDVAAAALIRYRERLGLAPHNVTIAVCAYVVVVSALWAMFSFRRTRPPSHRWTTCRDRRNPAGRPGCGPGSR